MHSSGNLQQWLIGAYNGPNGDHMQVISTSSSLVTINRDCYGFIPNLAASKPDVSPRIKDQIRGAADLSKPLRQLADSNQLRLADKGT